MSNHPPKTRLLSATLLASAAALLLAGCPRINANPSTAGLQPPVTPAALPPVEKNMVSLPAYRIEPPDILQIEMLKLVPRPPYRAEVFDVLLIQVANTLAEQPIGPEDFRNHGYYMVEA